MYFTTLDFNTESKGDLDAFMKQLWCTAAMPQGKHPRITPDDKPKTESSNVHEDRTAISDSSEHSSTIKENSSDLKHSSGNVIMPYCHVCTSLNYLQNEDYFVFGVPWSPKKKHKVEQYTAEVLVEIISRHD